MKVNLSRTYSCDFETINKRDDCRIWSWGSCKIWDKDSFTWGITMESFFDWCKMDKRRNATLYFHNLKFDGSFILSHLLNNGYEHIIDDKKARNKTFSTLISDMGQFYSMTIYFKKDKKGWQKINIIDSCKIINGKVSEIAETFGLPIKKGEIEYNKNRPFMYTPTQHELEYLRNDVEIIAMALHDFFSGGHTKMTMGSNGLSNYKEVMGKKNFERYFPQLEFSVDKFIRDSYKGGWVYGREDRLGQEIGKGVVLDVNSLFPSRMKVERLPYGEPLFFTGEYKESKLYPLYVQKFKCYFKLKEGYLPTLQIKNNKLFKATEYLKDDGGNEVTLTLTSIDLEMFYEHYDVEPTEFISGYKFKCKVGLYDEYIDHWFKEKAENKARGNKGKTQIAKFFLNTLYGKMGTNPVGASKIPYMDEEGIVRYMTTEEEIRNSVYIPMATFITAYARKVTIDGAQKCYERFVYADTDSLHLIGQELPTEIEVDSSKLGAWDDELYFNRAKYLCAKRYIEEIIVNKLSKKEVQHVKISSARITKTFNPMNVKKLKFRKLKITCSGMPSNLYTQVSWENFKVGKTYYGKLLQIPSNGGTVLEETEFTLSDKIFARF